MLWFLLLQMFVRVSSPNDYVIQLIPVRPTTYFNVISSFWSLSISNMIVTPIIPCLASVSYFDEIVAAVVICSIRIGSGFSDFSF